MGFFIDPSACQQAARIAFVFRVMRTGSFVSLFFFFSTVARGQGLSWVVDPIGFLTPPSRIFDHSRFRASSVVFSCDPGRRGDGFQFPRARVRRARVTTRPPCSRLEMRPPLFFSSFFCFLIGLSFPSLSTVSSPPLVCGTPHPREDVVGSKSSWGMCWFHLRRQGRPWDS